MNLGHSISCVQDLFNFFDDLLGLDLISFFVECYVANQHFAEGICLLILLHFLLELVQESKTIFSRFNLLYNHSADLRQGQQIDPVTFMF